MEKHWFLENILHKIFLGELGTCRAIYKGWNVEISRTFRKGPVKPIESPMGLRSFDFLFDFFTTKIPVTAIAREDERETKIIGEDRGGA